MFMKTTDNSAKDMNAVQPDTSAVTLHRCTAVGSANGRCNVGSVPMQNRVKLF